MTASSSRRVFIFLIAFLAVLLLVVNRGGNTPRVARTHLDRYLLGFLDPTEEGETPERPNLLHAGRIPSGIFPRVIDHRTRWTRPGDMPKTALAQHITGWSVFENLYAQNGTFYIVSDTPGDFPPIREMISSGYPMFNGDEEQEKQEPTDSDMQVISSREATKLFGTAASHVAGVSFVANDPSQFFGHYYHFCAEIFFGLWRTYSSLDPDITSSGDTYLPPPSRFIFPHIGHGGWRDDAKMNHVVLRAAFPSTSVETKQDWLDRGSTEQLYLFDLVVLTERTAASRGANYSIDDKMAAMADRLPANPEWWTPIRTNVLEFAGMPRDSFGRLIKDRKTVITYVVRQGRGRALDGVSHRNLVNALKSLEKVYGWEVNVIMLERLKKTEQIKLFGRTTILIGVHGNGLTHLLWMQPTASSTVIEIVVPGGFSSDYQVPARALGIEHYGIWNDTYFRSNSEYKPERNQPDGFHDNKIPAHAETIARLIVERITEPQKLSSPKPRSVPVVDGPPVERVEEVKREVEEVDESAKPAVEQGDGNFGEDLRYHEDSAIEVLHEVAARDEEPADVYYTGDAESEALAAMPKEEIILEPLDDAPVF